jgi:uncharacterized protein (DUF1684 family)
MMSRTAAAFIVVVAAALAGVACGTKMNDAQVKEVEAFRAKHEADYRREYVPLAGLFPLSTGRNTAGSADGSDIRMSPRAPASIGAFVLENNAVRFEAAQGAALKISNQTNGQHVEPTPITQAIELKDDEHLNAEGKKDGADEVLFEDIALWVHRSGERPTIRMRDPKGDAATHFEGFHWFPIDPNYRVTARFIKDPAPHEFHTPNQTGDDQVYTTEGVVEFTLNGQTIRMRPATTRPKRLYFIFRDGTSGKETYETARFLYSDLNDDGTTVLDFNEAYNPPCAFNPYTTCPLPLPENRLTVRILAGEKAYPHSPGHGAP